MTGTVFLAWEFYPRDGNLYGFWKCTRMSGDRDRCEAWVKMPVTQSGLIRKSAVVELPAGRAWMLRDEAIPDEAFEYAVLRHDVSRKECAA